MDLKGATQFTGVSCMTDDPLSYDGGMEKRSIRNREVRLKKEVKLCILL